MSLAQVMTTTPVDTRAAQRIALVGLPGSGKSSVARTLAQRRGWRLADLDATVAARSGQSLSAVFATEGEAGFRRREVEALEEALAAEGPVVVACGGGIVGTAAARRRLAAACTVVWLDGSDGELLARLGAAGDRPLLADDPPSRLAALRAARQPLYAKVAQLRVDVGGGDVEDIADRVEDAVAGVRLPPDGDPAAPPDPGAGEGVRVELGERSYPVLIGAGCIADLAGLLPPESRRVAVVTDRAVLGTGRRVLAGVRGTGRYGRIVALRGGERLKTWARAGRLVTELARLRLERGDCVVAVGGGTVGDVAGFAAATYLRGIAVVHVPTTLMAMVDSAVGGKTGVNLPRGKNLAGAFWQPRAVVCDLDVLRTLGERAHRAAFAEIVKYAMVLDDDALRALLEDRLDALMARDPAALAAVVQSCCNLKAAVVGEDERDAGRRAILNYGHTVGHALEAVAGFERLLHGEAVAVGMRVAGRLSVVARGCPNSDIQWQDGRLRRCGLGEVAGIDPEAVLERTHGDKKAREGAVRWVLLERRGAATPGHVLADEVVRSVVGEVLGP
ncbi:MAG TPA: 3-dehydroquinate synthase [Candidatus Dormibacteraeota bacterium]